MTCGISWYQQNYMRSIIHGLFQDLQGEILGLPNNTVVTWNRIRWCPGLWPVLDFFVLSYVLISLSLHFNGHFPGEHYDVW